MSKPKMYLLNFLTFTNVTYFAKEHIKAILSIFFTAYNNKTLHKCVNYANLILQVPITKEI